MCSAAEPLTNAAWYKLTFIPTAAIPDSTLMQEKDHLLQLHLRQQKDRELLQHHDIQTLILLLTSCPVAL